MNEVLKVLRKDTHIENFLIYNIKPSRFLQIAHTVQTYIAISIISGLIKSKNIEHAVRVLDIFNDANNKKQLKSRISYKDFHNDAINKEVNLKDHYILWIQEREKCRRENRQFDRHRVFTLCNYPWILDAANKSELLKI